MSNRLDTLWLNTNPSFQRFDKPLIRYLSNQRPIAQWDYYQNQDEATSLNVALTLLHDYLKSQDKPVHLVGHSTGGLLGLLYARKYPEKVQSLILLGIGVHPSVDWQVNYYGLRQFLPCSREIILAQMVHNLFGYQEQYSTKGLIEILERDLNTSPSSHSLYKRVSISPGGVSMPLMVCGSQDDVIVDSRALLGWQAYLKKSDRLWQISQGHHFFHYFHPHKVGRQIIKFWQSLPKSEMEKLSIPVVGMAQM